MIFGIIQFFVLGIVTIYELSNKSSAVFLWATLDLMFGIMHIISYIIPDYIYSVEVLNEASEFAILFGAIYLAVRVPFKKIIKMNFNIELRKLSKMEDRFGHFCVLMLWGAVIIYSLFVINESGAVIALDKTQVYKTMANGNLFFLLSSYMYYATAPILLYFLYKREKKNIFVVICAIMVRSFVSLSRMDIIILFIAIIGYLIIKLDRISILNIIEFVLLGVLVVYAIYALRTYRYYYGIKDLTKIRLNIFNKQLIDFIRTDNGELGLRQVFYFFIKNDNQFSGFNKGAGYLRMLLMPIPSRLLMGIKPEDMCITMGRAWKPEFKSIIQYTVTPTLFGDCYANFGFSGVWLGAFWALFVSIMDIIANQKSEILRLLLFCLHGTLYINIARGDVYNPLCYVWYCGIIIFIIYEYCRYVMPVCKKIVRY